MNVLFIGGTGNISFAVSELAVLQGFELFHLNRGNNKTPAGVKTIIANINDSKQVQNTLRNHVWDVVVNWIAFTADDIYRDFLLFNRKVKQYIFISSASVYEKRPGNAMYTENCSLDNPFWEYSKKKIACEKLLLELYTEFNFPVTIVRPSHTYNTIIPIPLGSGNEYTAIHRIKNGMPIVVHDNGTSLWTLTHASDFGMGIIGLFDNPKAIGEAFHITSDEVLTWNQIFGTIADAIGIKPNLVHIPARYIADFADKYSFKSLRGTLLGDKANNAVFDNSKIKNFVPGFRANIPFSFGIAQTLRWFKARPERMIVSEQTNRFLDCLINAYTRNEYL